MSFEIKKKYTLLSDIVYETIKDAIISGKLPAGEKVSETKLANEMEVSRTPVREALRKLSVEGFVKLESNTSFVINKFEKKDAMDVLSIRRVLEGEASRLAAINLTEECRLELQSEVELIDNGGVKIDSENYSKDDMSMGFVNYDVHFHDVIYRASGNEKLHNLSNLIQDRQVRHYMAKSFLKDSYNDSFTEQHKRIAMAILDRDPELAEKLAKEHVDFIAGIAAEIE